MKHYVFRVVKQITDQFTHENTVPTSTPLNISAHMTIFNDHVLDLEDDTIEVLDYCASVLVAAEKALYLDYRPCNVSIYEVEIGEKIGLYTPCKCVYQFPQWPQVAGSFAENFYKYTLNSDYGLNSQLYYVADIRPLVFSLPFTSPTTIYPERQIDNFIGVSMSRDTESKRTRKSYFTGCLGSDDYYWTHEGFMHLNDYGRFAQCRFPAFQNIIAVLEPVFSDCYLNADGVLTQGESSEGTFNLTGPTDFSAKRKVFYKSAQFQKESEVLFDWLRSTLIYTLSQIRSISIRLKDLFYYYQSGNFEIHRFSCPLAEQLDWLVKGCNVIADVIEDWMDHNGTDVFIGYPFRKPQFSREWMTTLTLESKFEVSHLVYFLRNLAAFCTHDCPTPIYQHPSEFFERQTQVLLQCGPLFQQRTWTPWRYYKRLIDGSQRAVDWQMRNLDKYENALRVFTNLQAMIDVVHHNLQTTYKQPAARYYRRARFYPQNKFQKAENAACFPEWGLTGREVYTSTSPANDARRRFLWARMQPGTNVSCPVVPYETPRMRSISRDSNPWDDSNRANFPEPHCSGGNEEPPPRTVVDTIRPPRQRNCDDLRSTGTPWLPIDFVAFVGWYRHRRELKEGFKQAIAGRLFYDETCHEKAPGYYSGDTVTGNPEPWR